MSQDPLARLRRTERREPRHRPTFPNDHYRSAFLDPGAETAGRTIGEAAVTVYRAHAVVLAERRVVEADVAARMLRGREEMPDRADDLPIHRLAAVQNRVVAAAGSAIQLGTAREEIALTAMRLVLRERLLAVADATLRLRAAITSVALQHLTTLLLATANGQVVQPTSLGHYLAGQLGPLVRTSARLEEAFGRLNLSPLGAVSGMATAVPVLRGRQAELLGFSGPIESTYDALAAADVLAEIAGIVSMMATELTRLIADLRFWARDDVGTMAPTDAYVHGNESQPQRRDPLVLDHLRARLLDHAAVPQQLTLLLSDRQMLGGEASSYRAFDLVECQLAGVVETLDVLGEVVATADVNRALFAHRANRGFATSSELADLLSIDFEIPRDEAVQLAERVVVEATEAGGEATTLKTEVIDGIALKLRGVEVGIEPETLAKVLSPKRFIERRDHPGG
ncbi:MAG TPA: lyase family protein, partial [Thermomicrobiales bacterium]|nr:lyase family protein [Thermomicrobiales bacterium]